ncbi:MAG: LLM class flavin-dependent oxidoreductase [Nitrososphaerales archaeon]
MSNFLSVAIVPTEPPDAIISMAKKAETLGFDRFMISDSPNRDTYAVQAVCATSTSSIQIGPSITNAFIRHPALTAASIATIHDISKGRAVLGIGGRNEVIYEESEDRTRQSLALREAIQIIRSLLSGERCVFKGRRFSLTGFRLDTPPLARNVPILVAAVSKRLEQIAGELADEIMIGPTLISRSSYQKHLENVKSGARNRSLETVHILPHVYCSCSKNRELAKKSVKLFAARALIENTKSGQVKPEDLGVSNEIVLEIEREMSSLKVLYALNYFIPERLDKLVSEEIVDAFSISGTPEDCSAKLEEIMRFGFNAVQIYLVPVLGHKERYTGSIETLDSLSAACKILKN